MNAKLPIALSALDEERWGVRTARISGVMASHLPVIMEYCRVNQVTFLIARCDADQLDAVHEMERQGFLLMDTMLYLVRDMRLPLPDVPSEAVRPVRLEEADAVSVLAEKTFRGYLGHYHADARLDTAACDAVYPSWTYRSCVSREVADEVLILEQDSQLVGFITLQLRGNYGVVPLQGVDPSLQGHGLGRKLISGALKWMAAHGAHQVEMCTQVTNLPSQKVWSRMGFEPSHAEYTFHKWFDE